MQLHRNISRHFSGSYLVILFCGETLVLSGDIVLWGRQGKSFTCLGMEFIMQLRRD